MRIREVAREMRVKHAALDAVRLRGVGTERPIRVEARVQAVIDVGIHVGWRIQTIGEVRVAVVVAGEFARVAAAGLTLRRTSADPARRTDAGGATAAAARAGVRGERGIHVDFGQGAADAESRRTTPNERATHQKLPRTPIERGPTNACVDARLGAVSTSTAPSTASPPPAKSPTLETVRSELYESTAPASLGAQRLSWQFGFESMWLFLPSATMPLTPPTKSPTPPAPTATQPQVRWADDGALVACGGGDKFSCTGATTGASAAAGGNAALKLSATVLRSPSAASTSARACSLPRRASIT